jgi:hypothetical protein
MSHIKKTKLSPNLRYLIFSTKGKKKHNFIFEVSNIIWMYVMLKKLKQIRTYIFRIKLKREVHTFSCIFFSILRIQDK